MRSGRRGHGRSGQDVPRCTGLLPVLVLMLRSEKALDITDGQAALLARMSGGDH
jgi:hypothetical protein